MGFFNIKSFPILWFAHPFATNNYEIELPADKNVIEITFIEDGDLFITKDNIKSHVIAGDFIINDYSSNFFVKSDNFHKHIAVCFKCEFDNLSFPTILHPTTSGNHCQSLMWEIIRARVFSPERSLYIVGLFFQILDELERIYSRSINSTQFSPYVKKAKQYISEHIHEPIKQSKIADYLGITPEYLCTIFKQCEGVAITPYINRIKLENIQSLIIREKISLRLASELFGYNDPNYVSRLYKKMFGYNISQTL